MQDPQHLLVKQQYEEMPYPNVPIEATAIDDLNQMFLSSIVNSFYLMHQQVIETNGKYILDVGCGSGSTSLILADANPGANIVGIDLSPASIAIAKTRLAYHGHGRAQFFAMAIEDLGKLGMMFDYINCHETLYFLPDPMVGMKAMRDVLKPKGIIRANLHSTYQRKKYFRSQKLWKFLGLIDDYPLEKACEIVRNIMEALNDSTEIKAHSWALMANSDEGIGMNFLLRGDRGFTILETFDLLAGADLDLISMVNWRCWNIDRLFKDPELIPEDLQLLLAIASEREKLHIFELLHPVHRLIDFWCGHAGVEKTYQPALEWRENQWQKARATLHPVLKQDIVKTALAEAIASSQTFNVSAYLKVTASEDIILFPNSAICLYLLWDTPLTYECLVQIWLNIKPLDILTMQPIDISVVHTELRQILIGLEELMLVMLEFDR
jgi:2-polyprenyl-3-methyl-5-hydroxy-6-metoxy-1,4-benzoquinol methylase